MYCIHCGVKLADTEKKCPLCNTVVYHPDFPPVAATPLYPTDKMPAKTSGAKALSGIIIILYLIPLVISFFSDIQKDGTLDWFGYVAGGIAVSYVILALPLWFRKPSPVIFAPCSFAAVIFYLHYVNYAADGNWFLSFAFPTVGALGIIICTVITLLSCLRRGKLYIFGGTFMATGALLFLIEYLMVQTFQMRFIGWSVYPLIVLVLLGSSLIYFAINRAAREIAKRKLFF